jgi:hypothetical protein
MASIVLFISSVRRKISSFSLWNEPGQIGSETTPSKSYPSFLRQQATTTMGFWYMIERRAGAGVVDAFRPKK